MNKVLSLVNPRLDAKSLGIDIVALLFIYSVPTFSHLFSLPVYFIEPMRIMLILAIAHTTKRNAILIAVTLPLFSYLVSAHPSIIKAGLISFELLLNVVLFFELSKIIKNVFWTTLLAVLISKISYYAVKFAFLSFAIMQGNLISTPFVVQVIMTLIFAIYMLIILRDVNNGSEKLD